MDIVKELAKNLKQKRTEKGYTREKLGALADVSAGAIALYENGTSKSPSLTVVAKLAQALEVSIDNLCGLTANLITPGELSDEEATSLGLVLKYLYPLIQCGIIKPQKELAKRVAKWKKENPISNTLKYLEKYVDIFEEVLNQLPNGTIWYIDSDEILRFLEEMESIEQLRVQGTLKEDIYQMIITSMYEKMDAYTVIPLKTGAKIITKENLADSASVPEDELFPELVAKCIIAISGEKEMEEDTTQCQP